jgi:dipeptidase E
MKLALFSQNLEKLHLEKLKTFFSKPLEEVNFLYINTPGNYKPYKSGWMIEGEKRWQNVFPKFQEFDLERAFRVDPNFNFREFFSSYDFIFISGGNIFVLTYWMQKTGCREILKNLIVDNKVVYGGASVGAIYLYKDMDIYKEFDDPTKAPEKVDEGLDLINFAPIPHWENEAFRPIMQHTKDKFEAIGVRTYPITDDQGLFFEDSKLTLI